MEEEEEEPRAIKTIPISSQKSYKMKTDPKFVIDTELYRSNSANDLLDMKENKRKIKSEKSKKKKHPFLQRTTSAKTYFDHYDYKNCEHCPGIDNILKKDKSKLSSFIEKNPSFLKLFGNPRYNKSSPFLFVEDHKNRIDDERIGLLPIPSKPKIIMKTKDEKNKLYEIQRKVVMMRRFQYGKKFNEEGFLNDVEGEDFFDKISKIQLWWKQMYKIIYIQKVFRGYRIRKRVNFILNFIDIINKWQRMLDNMKARRFLRKLMNDKDKIKVLHNNNLKGYDYMSKIRRIGKPYLNNNNIYSDNLNRGKTSYKNFLNNDDRKDNNYPTKINTYRDDSKNGDEENKNNSDRNRYINNDSILKNLNDLNRNRNKNRSIPKDKIKNGASLTKEYINKNDAINKIDKIGNNFKDYLKYKNNIKKKNNNDENNNKIDNGLYIDKIYIPNNIQQSNNLYKIHRPSTKEGDNKNKNKYLDDDKVKSNNKYLDLNKLDNKNKNLDIVKNKLIGDNINKIYSPNMKDMHKDENIPENEDKNIKANKEDNNDENNKKNNKEANKGDENNNIINSNDFIFKNKDCYIEKLRITKNVKDSYDNQNNKDNKYNDDKDKENLDNDNNNNLKNKNKNDTKDNKDDKTDKDKYNTLYDYVRK